MSSLKFKELLEKLEKTKFNLPDTNWIQRQNITNGVGERSNWYQVLLDASFIFNVPFFGIRTYEEYLAVINCAIKFEKLKAFI